MKEHSGPCCVNLTTKRLLPRSEQTPPWVKSLQVHEVNGPHHGLKIYNLRVHEMSGPHHGLKIYKFTKWMDPTMG